MNEHAGSAEPSVSQTADDAPFEVVLERLQGVVEQLEAGDLPLEQSLSAFEEGIRLARLGSTRLEEAEHRVEVLLAEGGPENARPLGEEFERG